MLEQVRRCDMPVGTKGNVCNERVSDDEPTSFMVLGTTYEADLCDKHRQEFLQKVTVYVDISRVIRPSTTSRPSVRKSLRGRKAGEFSTKDVREWLREQGRDVAPSGRLPKELMDEYARAH